MIHDRKLSKSVHASHVQTAPCERRILQYSKIRNFLRSPDDKEELYAKIFSHGLGIRTPERGLGPLLSLVVVLLLRDNVLVKGLNPGVISKG